MSLDTQIAVVTPENISFQYEVAGPFRRLPAYLIDVMIRIGVGMVLAMLVIMGFWWTGLADVGVGVLAVLWFLMSYFYGALFETFWNGQTPGKRIMGLRVLTVEGQPINALQAVLRNVLRDVDSLPLPFLMLFPDDMLLGMFHYMGLYTVGLVAVMWTTRYQRLGDLACGTMVVVDRGGWLHGVVRTDEPEVLKLAAAIPADFAVNRTLARALASYVDRRRRFMPGRRADIARHVGAPLVAQFGLPPSTSHDLLLCALYHRTFLTDRTDEPTTAPAPNVTPSGIPIINPTP